MILKKAKKKLIFASIPQPSFLLDHIIAGEGDGVHLTAELDLENHSAQGAEGIFGTA